MNEGTLTPPRPPGKEHRRFRRLLPVGASLMLRPTGLLSAFSANIARGIMNICEGGLAAVVTRRCAVGEILKADVVFGPYREGFEVQLRVRHVEPCQNTPGCFIVGGEFVDAPAVLRVCVRSVIHQTLVRAMQRRKAGVAFAPA